MSLLPPSLTDVSRLIFGSDPDRVPVSNFLTTYIFASLTLAEQRALSAWLADAGIPANLSPRELRLFEERPEHPLFTPIDRLELTPQTEDIVATNGVRFVIDAVHALPKVSYRHQRKLKELIEAHLGGPVAKLDVDRELLDLGVARPKVDLDQPLALLLAGRGLALSWADSQVFVVGGVDPGAIPTRAFLANATQGGVKIHLHGNYYTLRRLMAETNLPIDLTRDEVRLYETNPEHPLFHKAETLPIAVAVKLRDLTGLLPFVIDLVRAVEQGKLQEFGLTAAEIKMVEDALAQLFDRPAAVLNVETLVREGLYGRPEPVTFEDCRTLLAGVRDEPEMRETVRQLYHRSFPNGER